MNTNCHQCHLPANLCKCGPDHPSDYDKASDEAKQYGTRPLWHRVTEAAWQKDRDAAMSDEAKQDAPATPDASTQVTDFKYFRSPFEFREPKTENDGPFIYDADGHQIAMLFWPTHPVEETEAAEQETYRLGILMADAADLRGKLAEAQRERDEIDRMRFAAETEVDLLERRLDAATRALQNCFIAIEGTILATSWELCDAVKEDLAKAGDMALAALAPEAEKPVDPTSPPTVFRY